MTNKHLLLVEDDRALADLVTFHFERSGYDVTRTGDGEEALILVDEVKPDIILLDWMIEGISGIEVCRRLRRRATTANVPIMMLTARGEEADRIRGFETGADDYVTKPFSPRELVARIKAVLRRSASDSVKAPDADAYAFGDWVLRTGERELVDKEGRAVPLSTGEYNLLLALVTHPKRVLTRDQLLDLSQHREMGAFERSIDNHISRLRKKIEPDPADPRLIKTVWGGGYTLAADVRRI